MTSKTLKRQARTRAATLGHNLYPFARGSRRRFFRAVCSSCYQEAIVDWMDIRGDAVNKTCERSQAITSLN